MSIISVLKKLPIDVGQAERKHDSAGKLIAFSFVKNVQVGEQKKALDIGCRDGYWTKKLEQKGYKVTALDLDPLYQPAIKHNIEQGLPFPEKSFDVVWCTEVIEHLYKPEFALQEIDRVLVPGGLAVITTPNSGWFFYTITKLWGWTPKKLQNPDHKQFFSEQGLKDVAREYDIMGYFPYAVKFFKIRKLVGLLSPTFICVRSHDKVLG